MKNKVLYLAIFFLGWTFMCKAQNKSVESARVAFITQKINLSPVQAEKFWPVFNEFNSHKKDNRRAIRALFNKLSDQTEQNNESIKQILNQISAYKLEEVTIEKKYYDLYLLILSPRQLADLLLAEREFQKILIKRVSEE